MKIMVNDYDEYALLTEALETLQIYYENRIEKAKDKNFYKKKIEEIKRLIENIDY